MCMGQVQLETYVALPNICCNAKHICLVLDQNAQALQALLVIYCLSAPCGCCPLCM
jgi:hypothetical protein